MPQQIADRLQPLPYRLLLVFAAPAPRDLLPQGPDLVRHRVAELRGPLGPRQRLPVDEQLSTSGVRAELPIGMRLHVDHNAAVPEDDTKLLETSNPRAARRELVKLVLVQGPHVPGRR